MNFLQRSKRVTSFCSSAYPPLCSGKKKTYKKWSHILQACGTMTSLRESSRRACFVVNEHARAIALGRARHSPGIWPNLGCCRSRSQMDTLHRTLRLLPPRHRALPPRPGCCRASHLHHGLPCCSTSEYRRTCKDKEERREETRMEERSSSPSAQRSSILSHGRRDKRWDG